jgi:hypothetical protein
MSDLKEKPVKGPGQPAMPGGELGRRRERQAPSLFGPVVLIAIGLFFLLNNIGLLPVVQFNWVAALQLWPLFLILLGINLLVRQAPSPVGGFLSALVGITAVAIFGYVLLFSEDNSQLARWGLNVTPAEVKTEQIAFSAAGLQSAEIDLSLGASRVMLFPLEDSPNLIEGQVSYLGELEFEAQTTGSRATVLLRDKSVGLFWLNPVNWGSLNLEPWELGLNPSIPLDLRLRIGAGSTNFDLNGLLLSGLSINGGAGSMVLLLPNGDYNARVDVGAGSTRVTLAENGQQRIELDGGAGSLTLLLPPGREARVEVSSGAGSLNLERNRFTQVQGSSNKEGVWQTSGYRGAEDPLDVKIDIGAGSVTIREP